MAKAKFFNKGLAKGTVSKSEIVTFKNKNGVESSFLSMEVATGNGNKTKITHFPSKANTARHQEAYENFPVGSMVEVVGSVSERAYDNKAGKQVLDRGLSANSFKPLIDTTKTGATFIIQGIITKMRETEDGVEVAVNVDTSYTNKDNKVIEQSENFNLTGDSEIHELMESVDAVVGCNVKFKGRMVNQLEFDDYGDIVASTNMFKVERVEDVIEKDDLIEETEELGFL